VKYWTRWFAVLSAYGFVSGTIYWLLTQEWAGTFLFVGFGFVPAIILGFMWRRGWFRQAPPRDDPDADPNAFAGEDLGAFPHGSAWPVFLALGAIALGAAIIYGLILVPIGVGLVAWAVLGLMRESRG
jgi:Cytochrome c oxidase subunit IV